MSPPGLLLWGAIPVPPGQQEEGRRSQLPALLRGDGVLTRVLANLPTHASSPAPPRSSCRDVGTLTYEDELLPSAASLLPSAPHVYPSLPDLVQTCPAPSATSPAPDVTSDVTSDVTTVDPSPPISPDPPDLHWTLQLLLQHLNPVASPPAKDRAGPRGGARPRSSAHQGGLQGHGRAVTPARWGRGRAGMTSTLRQVGQELRRIADRVQLRMLMDWPRYEQAMYQIINSYPSWVGLAGCVVVCGSIALLTRPLGQ